MDQEKIVMKMKIFSKYSLCLLVLLTAAFFISCANKKIADVQFSYRGIIDKEYRFNVGRVIPVTISQSIETDGDISADGNYFFYSSNMDGGNFDIYLRLLGDITTVRLTAHPSKDTSPVISPDGKRLAFVSFRDDPEGDIFILKLKPEDLLKRAASGEEIAPLDTEAVNITMEKNPDTGVIINIKDSNPCWSPDGSLIAFSSPKDGEGSIWVMDRSGGSKKKVSPKDGFYPAFSPDGKKIIYVSYSDNIYGDIYSVEIASGKTERLTSGDTIKLYPSYCGGTDKIIYSSIENDSNGNRELDLQDKSVIRLHDIKDNLSYPLTKKSDTSFKAKWLPVLNTRDYNGVIIYTDITGENINLNIIPEAGIIPKKLNAKLQYELCETYTSEYDDEERYAMALESVNYFYGKSGDTSSRAYVNRSLKEAVLYYISKKDTVSKTANIAILKKKSAANDLYAAFLIDLIENRRPAADALIRKISEDKNNRYFAPFAMEDLADLTLLAGGKKESVSMYNSILKQFPEFERSNDLLTKISTISDDLRKGVLSEAAVTIINKGNTNQKISITSSLINPLEKNRFSAAEASETLSSINSLKTKFSADKKIMPILALAAGIVNDSAGKTESAKTELEESIKLSHPNDLTYYIANIRLAEMERRLGRNTEAEKYYSAGINRYSRRFKTENFRDKLLWIINYYEQAGERSSSKGDFNAASQVYDKYINLITLIHNKRLFPEIYTEYAPRAHVLYIDAYTELKGEQGINELEKSYNDKLPVLRMDFNRAALYGLAYIYTKKAMLLDAQAQSLITTVSKDKVFENLYLADRQIEWALFLDDTFIEPYLLKSWINTFIDLQRKEYGDDIESAIGGYFPKRLWEKNIPLLDKALNANNEKLYPENEGNIHINLGNTYFLLVNYPRALNHYSEAGKYKKTFSSDVEKALFHFHTGYTLWQNGEVKDAREEISKAYGIYSTLAAGSSSRYKNQILALYRYFALFSRYEGKFSEAINWYKKILKHAEDNKIEIDKARYMQEIAFCLKELGDYDTAKSYIDSADRLLRDYPEDTKKYYLRIKLFGIGPFPVYNMGPDTAVIGDNKIFYPLDKWNKELLSISLLEEISVKNSNYAGAIEYLKKKISLLEEYETSVAIETRIRSLNNLGYYYFRSGNISEAEKKFNEAGNLASKTNNLQGVFSSMMNLTNLYALMIDKGRNEGHNWIYDTEKFLSKIEKYRNSYFDMRFNQEREALEAAAEAKKTEVTPEQISTLKQDIEKQTAGIYYALDISIAIMKFYRAELLYTAAASSKGDNPQYNLYTHNREIYNLYAEALKMIEGAIIMADRQGNRELKVKLLLNAAHCYEKIGEHEKAYVALIDARNISDQFRFGWTGINANFAMGAYLADYGKEVESGDSRGLAEKYMSAAVSRIEEHPLLYTSRTGKIRRIYNRYAEFLINTGRGERAFYLMEKLSRVERITSVNSANPVFSDEYDRNSYFTYLSEIAKLGEIREKRTALLASGAAAASSDVEQLNKKEKAQEERLARLFREIENKISRIAPYLELKDVKMKAAHDIYSFMETDHGIYSWKLSDGKISSGYLKSDSADVAASLINEGSAKKGIFILLNDTSLKLITKYRDSITGNFSFINTIDRADVFSKGGFPAGNIISSIKGVESPSADVKVLSQSEGFSLSDFAVIIDSSENGKLISGEKLFSGKGISPDCIILAGAAADSSRMALMLEAALYSGSGSIIYSIDNSSKSISSIAAVLYGGNGSKEKSFIKSGYINALHDKKPADYKKAAAAEFAAFNEAINKTDFEKASVSLSRWRAMSPDEKYQFMASGWLLYLFKGDYSSSLKLIESYNPVNADEGASLIFMRLYTLLHKGDFAEATILRKKIAGMEKYPDLEFIDALFDSVNGRDSAAERIFKIAKPYNTLIPAERYLVLAAEYIYLFNPEMSARVIRLIPVKQMSLNERMMKYVITGEKPDSGISPRIDRIVNLAHYEEAADESMKLIKAGDHFDALSVFPPLVVLAGNSVKENAVPYISGLDLDKIAPASYIPAMIALLQKCYSSIPENGTNAERIKILRLMKKVSSDSSVFHVIRESMYRIAVELMISGDYSGAYNEASAADERFSPEDRGYTAAQLLLANLLIREGEYKKAEEKCAIVKKISPLKPEEKYLLDLQLSMLELNRLRSLKRATSQDAAEFEKLFASSLNALKLNPGILNIHGYRDMTAGVFDEYINYKMKTGQHSDAHFYNEMKKLIISSSITGINLVKSAGTIDITAIQQAMPERCGYINISKVKNDIFIWIVDSKMKKALWIENGYRTLSELLPKYRLSVLKESEVKKASADLAEYFQPLEAYFKSRKQIVFSTDSFTEQIPFEIIGKDKMLSEEVKISYIASPLLLSSSKGGHSQDVRFIGKQGSSFQSHVEKAAVRESGIKTIDSESSPGGMAHITGEISYTSPEKGYLMNGKGFISAIGTPDFLYATIGEYHGTGHVDFILNARAAGVKAAVINTSPVNDLNRGVFAGEFYRSINSGKTLIDSFTSAMEKTRNDSRYRSPAAWGGFRLYIYNLGYLKE